LETLGRNKLNLTTEVLTLYAQWVSGWSFLERFDEILENPGESVMRAAGGVCRLSGQAVNCSRCEA